MRKTKIVATVGPSCDTPDKLEALLAAGVDVFRLNFSHGTLEQKAPIIAAIREASRRRGKAVAILGDLQGPKVRVCALPAGASEFLLEAGEQVVLSSTPRLDARIIVVDYPYLAQDVMAAGVRVSILLDDGHLELQAESVVGGDVTCRVVVGGLLKLRKGVNLPGCVVSLPALTEADRAALAFAAEQKLDWLALSFVQRPEDILEVKELLRQAGSELRVVAKIEKPQAVERFDEILAVTDGVMVARGDLGVEMRPEQVPLVQKRLIADCRAAGKPVITATQMLESMIVSARPTRAEVSDVANAILDGTDAVMLSAETASGQYPVAAVEMMVRIALDVEPLRPSSPLELPLGAEPTEAIGRAACSVAEAIGAKAILAFTQTGGTAKLVAKYRPRLPLFAVTPTQSVRRRLALYSGVGSLKVVAAATTEAQIEAMEKVVIEAGVLSAGDLVVITMGSPIGEPGSTNLLKIHRLGAPRSGAGQHKGG